MIIVNQTQNTTLANNAKLANTFLTRLKGLLGSPPLEEGQGLLLQNEKSIHTMFMGFPIDIVYIDQNHSVIKLTPNMLPYRLGPYISQAVYILELPVGIIEKSRTTVGDKLTLVYN